MPKGEGSITDFPLKRLYNIGGVPLRTALAFREPAAGFVRSKLSGLNPAIIYMGNGKAFDLQQFC